MKEDRDKKKDNKKGGNSQPSDSKISSGDIALLEECERLKAEAAQWKDKCLRVQAEFENARKRMQKEQEDFKKFAEYSIVSDILPLLDDFDRAVDACRKNKDVDIIMKGVEMIGRDIKALLAKYGVVEMDCQDKLFNPEYHEAIAKGTDDSRPDGAILEVYQKGYLYKERVLRPAVVKVNNLASEGGQNMGNASDQSGVSAEKCKDKPAEEKGSSEDR